MIKDFFLKPKKSLTEIILQTTRELGKYYSRLELASSKLKKRDKELFDACSFYLKNNSKSKATIYANEIAEIRKILSILQHIQLSVERAILRLDTLKVISPTLESLKEVFGEVRNALGLVANVMPSITPEIDRLNNVIGEILEDTQFNLTMPAPLVFNDPTTEAIIQEAASFVERELQEKIPEPPVETKIPKPEKPRRPLIALAAVGSQAYPAEEVSVIKDDTPLGDRDKSSLFLLEELVMDYIERNNGEMNVTKCAKELNVPPAEVFAALRSLSKKGKIKIEQ